MKIWKETHTRETVDGPAKVTDELISQDYREGDYDDPSGGDCGFWVDEKHHALVVNVPSADDPDISYNVRIDHADIDSIKDMTSHFPHSEPY